MPKRRTVKQPTTIKVIQYREAVILEIERINKVATNCPLCPDYFEEDNFDDLAGTIETHFDQQHSTNTWRIDKA